MKKPLPGTIGLAHIGGALGVAIQVGQAIAGDDSYWTHAFIVLDDETVLEAEPSGARIVPLAPYLVLGKAVFFDPLLGTRNENIRRRFVVAQARKHVGDKYSFATYLYLALVHFGIKPKWLLKRIKDSNHAICSALVDKVFMEAGTHFWADGRDPSDVTPGDLDRLRLQLADGASLPLAS